MVDAPTTSTAAKPVNRKARVGVVVSDKGDQTIIVAIERASPHRLYHKVIRRTKRYPVHDPQNAATTGDLVRIEECRPISKTKRWQLVEVLLEREVAQVAPTAIDATLVTEMQRSAARAAEEAEESEGAGEPTMGEAPAASAESAAAATEPPAAAAVTDAAVAETATTTGGEVETPAGDQETGSPAGETAATETAPEGGEQTTR
jgi:small subunit ribosomal protein S17